jgi:type II secretory ATPase GspE/PulE/Tfp pilus assembly ATPase PilB-like protein
MNLRENSEGLFMDAIQQGQMAIRHTAAYPGDHPAPRESVSKSYETLADLLNKQDMLTVCVFGDKLVVDDVPIDGKNGIFAIFAKDLRQRDIDSITFHRGLSHNDFTIFLDAMIKRPNILTQEGGVASILKQQGVSTIKLNEIKYGKISKKSKELENSHIIDYLSGENDTLGDYGHNLLHILENDPQRVSDLIMQVTEARDIAVDTCNQAARAKVAVETMSRIATELLGRQGVKWSQFKDNMTSILSACDEGILIPMSQTMEIIERGKDEIIDGLVDEFFHDAIADICVNEYREKGQFDVKYVEGLIPSVEERKKLVPHVKRKLQASCTLDEEDITPTEDLKDSDAPVVRLVNLIIREAITQKASDIHTEPYENELRVRFRIDGTLSTLHTNSAPETITRLLDMGIEPYLITSSLNLVVAQRLMRKVCPNCKVEASPNDLQLKLLKGYGFDISGHQLFRGEGCEECNDTGYKGRVAIYEVMPLWQEIQELILQGESSVAIREKAEDLGLVTLQEQGFNKVMEGVTSLDEWMGAVA